MSGIATSVGPDDRAEARAASVALPAGGWSPLLGEIALALETALRAAGAIPHAAMGRPTGLGEVPVWGAVRCARSGESAPGGAGSR
jgi:hypothetical protein